MIGRVVKEVGVANMSDFEQSSNIRRDILMMNSAVLFSAGLPGTCPLGRFRINYFIELCRQASAAAEGQSIQAKQLANRSGYRSYRTFSVAFKQRTGQSVKDWIAEQESALQANKD